MNEHVALISEHAAGSSSTLTAMVQYFAVFLILSFFAAHWEQPPHLSNKTPQS